MPLKAGTKRPGASNEDQYAGSMAEAIEHAFMQEWLVVMGPDAPAPNDQMRLLFIAVAQGVVKHLSSHHDSFKVTVPSVGGNNIPISIGTEGPLY